MQRDSPRVLKRSQKACTECRQVKLRCDGMQNFPAPCSRCRKNKLECRTDPTFQRKRTKDRLNEVTSQLTAIQQTLGRLSSTSGTQPSQLSTHSVSEISAPSDQLAPLNVVGNSLDDSNEPFFYRDGNAENLPEAPMLLGQTLMDGSQIEILLDHFQKYYYRHCPILHPNRTATVMFRCSPFLFWTIIIISSRFHPTLAQTYHAIVGSYRELLGKILAEPITTLESIQGIILLCLWPLAVRKQSEDSSWNYCGLVTNAAIRMGLQKGGTEGNTPLNSIAKMEARIRRKTWMACLKLNSTFIWRSEACLHLDIMDTARVLTAPLSNFEAVFATKLQIGRQSSKAALFMAKIHHHADISIIEYLCRDLDDVKHEHRNTWSEEAEIELLGAQLNIYAFQLQRMSPAQESLLSSSENTMLKKMLINLGFTAAVRIIHIFSTMTATESTLLGMGMHGSSLAEPSTPIQRYLPKHYFVTLLFATSFIFKAMANNKEENSSRDEIARNHIRLTHQMLISWSDHRMDEFGRGARMIEVLSRASNPSGLKEFHSHGGASVSVLEDTVQTAKEIRESMETVGAAEPDYYYKAPRSLSADPSSKTLPESMGSCSDPDFDGLNNFEFDWNSPWGFSMTASDNLDFGFSTEPSDDIFNR